MTNCNMYVCHNKFNKNEQNVAVQLLTGVVKHAMSDHFGRKVFDELQLGKELMNPFQSGTIPGIRKPL